MAEDNSPPPAPDSQPQISEDGRFYLEGSTWKPIPVEPVATETKTVTAGILWAALVFVIIAGVIWFIVSIVHSNDGLDCAIRNADHAQNGEPAEDCPQ